MPYFIIDFYLLGIFVLSNFKPATRKQTLVKKHFVVSTVLLCPFPNDASIDNEAPNYKRETVGRA